MAITKPQYMRLVMQSPGGQNVEPGGWRWPTTRKAAFLDEDVYIKAARLAEQAKLNGLFIADSPAITMDISHQPPHHGFLDSAWISAQAIAPSYSPVSIRQALSTTR